MKQTYNQRAIKRERWIKLFTVFVIILTVMVVLLAVENMLVSFLIAFVIYFLLDPFVGYLERRGFSRHIATLIPFVIVTVTLGLCIKIFLPIISAQLENLQIEYPKYVAGVNTIINNIEAKFNSIGNTVTPVDFGAKIRPALTHWASQIFEGLPAYISQSLTTLFLAPFLAFFMLVDGRGVMRTLLSIVPNNYFELFLNLNHQIGTQMGSFIRARLLEAAIVGLVVWVGLIFLGFPYTLILAVFAGALNLIPYLGPLIGAAPAVALSLINGGNSVELLWIAVIYSSAQIIDAAFIVPLVVAKIVDLHPVTVVLVVLIGSQIMGILGMIISIPVASALKVTLSVIYKHLTR